jgi:integrase
MECCTLRLRDLDFSRGQIVVRGGKGDKDRLVMMPMAIRAALVEQTERVRRQHERDSTVGGGWVQIPPALLHKRPGAAREPFMQFLFASSVMRRDGTGRGYRWHMVPSHADRIVVRAARRAAINKRVTCHTLRHSRGGT